MRVGARASCPRSGKRAIDQPAGLRIDRCIKYDVIRVAQLIVRDLEDDVKTRPQRRATRHRRSPEAEARDILRNAAKDESMQQGALGTRIGSRFSALNLKEGELAALPWQSLEPMSFEQ